MGVWRLNTLRLLAVAAVLFAMIGPSQSWRRRRRRRRCTTPSYDHKLARRMWLYSQAAYDKSVDSLEAWTCSYCKYTDVSDSFIYRTVHDHFGSRALVGYDKTLGAVVVAFRGSANALNWIANAAAWRGRFKYGSGSVHKGFLQTYKAVRGAYLSRVEQLVRDRLKRHSVDIYFTGHSLGAAMATLAAVDVARRSGTPITYHVRMYNFGSPPVGNSAFVSDYSKRVSRSYRFANNNDLFTLPHSALGYRHVPKEVKLCSGGGHSTYLGVTGRRRR